MIHLDAEFYTGAAKAEHFPNTQFPEIAFSGRSNVGKSSLLNSIVNKKKTGFYKLYTWKNADDKLLSG